jgi:hypothetical protein
VLPTTLPLAEYFEELRRLYSEGAAPWRQLRLLRKSPLREIPAMISKGERFDERLRSADLDYA